MIPDVTVDDDRVKSICNVIMEHLHHFKNQNNSKINLEVEAKMGVINIKDNIPYESVQILHQTLDMNPNWQVFLSPPQGSNIQNAFYFKSSLNSFCNNDPKKTRELFGALIN